MKIADNIKQLVTMSQLAEHYGFKVDRRGFMKCPFHNEKDGSLKVYKGSKGFWCYGCNSGGSVIDFAMKHFNINLSQAIIRIDNDFNLNLTNKRPDIRTTERIRKEKAIKDKHDMVSNLIYEYWLLEFKRHFRNFRDLKPKPFEDPHEDFIEALRNLPQIEEWLTKERR
jgi:DNA primase